jgi:hypothetical protein
MKRIPLAKYEIMGPLQREHVLENYGFSRNTMNIARAMPNPLESLQYAMHIAEENGIENPTLYMLADVCFGKEKISTSTSIANAALNAEYGNKKRLLKADGLDIPMVHFLKTKSKSNLIEMSEYYKEFQATNNDFIIGIKLPESIGKKESKILGMLYLSINELENIPIENYVFHLNHNDNGNLSADVGKMFNMEERKSNTFQSKAVYTWLRNDMGFGEGEIVSEKIDRDAFIDGMLSCRKTLGSHRKTRYGKKGYDERAANRLMNFLEQCKNTLTPTP